MRLSRTASAQAVPALGTTQKGNAPAQGLTPRAVERLMRVRGDLKLGLPVALTSGEAASDGALVAFAETVNDERLEALRAMAAPGAVELVLTRNRAEALGMDLPDNLPAEESGGVVTLDIPAGADLEWLASLAGEGLPAGKLRSAPMRLNAGGPLHAVALALAKSAHVLPAAVLLPRQDAAGDALRLGLSMMETPAIMDALEDGAPQTLVSAANLPMDASQAGRVHVFRPDDGGVEHYAIEIGTPDFTQPVTVRLHSACFTGDVLSSLKCDCGPQLRTAMATMASGSGGVILYLNQEGRGIGLANKMRAYALQEAGLDTVEANHWLGFDDDERDFRVGGNILHWLGISRVRLMTNNPAKIAILASQGIDVTERVPLKVGGNAVNANYLATKAAKSGHLLT
ncbi:GTP cyclohydrolase II [Roseovarius nanhaiticus]|uniref:GTP cyclohydrolase-2 n=2 Tax=Roseovarius nanhaiticus TaxID=573024 RepID=A0A1N7G1G0_9RHOB|nr:GTP cyclohydrolase II [Roseovarius nanhaiticus]SIS06450.1 GTP cyclohydrolase II [Roseovarius nanhaiticus]